MRGRGQTQLDYLVGVSVVLLTLTGVFLFVPGVFQTFDQPVDQTERTAADRLSENLIHESAVTGTQQTLNYSELDRLLGADWGQTRGAVGLPIGRDVNVTVENSSSSGELLLTAGDSYNREPAAQSTRLVTFQNDSQCEQLCRLTVRVWFE